MMISVLKIMVDRIVDVGDVRCMMLSMCSCGQVVMNVVGMIVKYFVMLFVIENVVSDLCVISICLLILMIFISLVGFELRLIMLLVFFVVCVLVFIVIVMLVCVSVGVLLVLLFVIVMRCLVV